MNFKLSDNSVYLLSNNCLVLEDEDFYESSSINDITVENIRLSLDDYRQALMVLYRGKFGEKVLKLRLREIKRNDIM